MIVNSLTEMGKFLNFYAQQRTTDAHRIKIWPYLGWIRSSDC
jgi:hypothetical protein